MGPSTEKGTWFGSSLCSPATLRSPGTFGPGLRGSLQASSRTRSPPSDLRVWLQVWLPACWLRFDWGGLAPTGRLFRVLVYIPTSSPTGIAWSLLSAETLGAEAVVHAYKDLAEVEQAFRVMKGFALEVGPIRHRLDERVRAHVFLCMLAHYVRWHMEEALAPMLLTDHDPQGGVHLVGTSSDQILYILPSPDPAGRTALRLSALEFLDRLAKVLPPPRIHRHRYHGVFAPNAPLRPLVTARAPEDNALAAQVPGLPFPATPTVSPPKSEAPAPQPPDTGPSRPSKWAALLARIYEVFPLVCPTCQMPLTFIAFLTEPEPITHILSHIGELTSPPLIHPARGPPQTQFAMGPGQPEQDEVAQESFPDDLDQSPEFDPAEPEPVPEDDFDQNSGA
jgi:hypothetical protein